MLQFYIRCQELMKYHHLLITLKMLSTLNKLLMAKNCDLLFYLHCSMKIPFNLSWCQSLWQSKRIWIVDHLFFDDFWLIIKIKLKNWYMSSKYSLYRVYKWWKKNHVNLICVLMQEIYYVDFICIFHIVINPVKNIVRCDWYKIWPKWCDFNFYVFWWEITNWFVSHSSDGKKDLRMRELYYCTIHLHLELFSTARKRIPCFFQNHFRSYWEIKNWNKE